jgi:hypothetical protein
MLSTVIVREAAVRREKACYGIIFSPVILGNYSEIYWVLAP